MEKEKKIKKFAAEAYCSTDKETATKSASPDLMPIVAQATNRHDRCSAAVFHVWKQGTELKSYAKLRD